jgi:hypothetical protein
LSDCAVKDANQMYDIALGVQAGINELSDAGKKLAASADMRSTIVFSPMPPGKTSGNNVPSEVQHQSVSPPALSFDAFRGNDFGGGGQPSYGGFGGSQFGGTTGQSSYGDFGGYGSRASAEFFGGGQSSNGGFGGGVSGGGQSNRYQV